MQQLAHLLAGAVLGATLLAGAEASAQPSAATIKTADYTERQTGGDQVVIFGGDELPAPRNGAYGNVILKLPGVVRVGLIRPRVNFVSELLKSIENI